MLHVPTPFPEIGSYALRVGAETELVRIQAIGRERGTVLLSIPDRFGATGNMTVPLESLQDGTPLTTAEQAELTLLGRIWHGTRQPRTGKQKASKARHDQLRLRRIYAEILRHKLRAAGLSIDVPPHAVAGDQRIAA